MTPSLSLLTTTTVPVSTVPIDGGPIRIATIDLDASPHARASLDDGVVADYAGLMRDGVHFPPIVVFYDGVRRYLADGWHRVRAAQQAEIATLPCVLHKGDRDAALWFALGANREHGVRLTGADKRRAVLLAMDTWPDRSQRQIALHIGCDQSYVSKLSRHVMPRHHVPDRVTGKDGKSYPAHLMPKVLPVSEPISVPRPAKTKAERAARLDRLRALVADGYTSPQIAAAIGVTAEHTRLIAKHAGIVIRADAIVGKPRRLDPNRIVGVMAMQAENLCADTNLIEFDKLDRTRIVAWVAAFEHARRDLATFIRQLKEHRP